MPLKKIIDGVFQVEFDTFDVFQLQNAHLEEKSVVKASTKFLALELGFGFSEAHWWNSFPIGGNIKKPPYSWHHDHTDKTKKCDTLLLMYFVDEELTEETGGRIGFSDLQGKNKKYYNIVSGSCFIANQYTTLHSVEIIKKQLTKRLCINCGLFGWDNFYKELC